METSDVTNQNHSFSSDEMSSKDAELKKVLHKKKAKIKIVGAGGAGNNTVNRIAEVGIAGAQIIAVNTDAQDLLYTKADKKVLIGEELTAGLGAGADPKKGGEAALESEKEIKETLEGTDMVFITCGLGGGTGTGSAPVIAEVSKKDRCVNGWNCDSSFLNGGHQKIR